MSYQEELSEVIGAAKATAKQKVKAVVELDLTSVVDRFIDNLHARTRYRLSDQEHDGELNDTTFRDAMFDMVTEIYNIDADQFDYPEPSETSSGYNLYRLAPDAIDEKVDGSSYTTLTDMLTGGVSYAMYSLIIEYCNAEGVHINDIYAH